MKQLSLEGLHDLFCNPVFGEPGKQSS